MKTSKALFAIMTCVVIAATGCAEKRESAPCVKITPTIETRVTGLHFDAGDCIGLTITKQSGIFAGNRMLTYDGSAFTSPGFLWYNDLHETSTLTAYYPYSGTGVPAEFSVATDQSAGCTSSDLLGAVKTGVTPGAAPVGMLFYHLMSQLSILVTNNSDASVSGITVSGLVPTAVVDLAVPTASVKRGVGAASVRAFEVTPDAAYRVVLVPQQAALTVTVFTEDGKNRSRTISSALLESGWRYDLSVEVNNIDISLSLSAEIKDWQDGGSLGDGGSDGPGGGPGPGPDSGKIEFKGQTYRTATIDGRVWMAENLRHIPDDAVIEEGIWYPIDGSGSVASQGMLYDYDMATAGSNGSSGAAVQGICPTGWHLPDTDDLTSLMQSSERTADFFCCGGYRIFNASGSKYGSANKGFLLGAALQDDTNKCSCLSFDASGKNLELTQISAEFGLTVRCVR